MNVRGQIFSVLHLKLLLISFIFPNFRPVRRKKVKRPLLSYSNGSKIVFTFLTPLCSWWFSGVPNVNCAEIPLDKHTQRLNYRLRRLEGEASALNNWGIFYYRFAFQFLPPLVTFGFLPRQAFSRYFDRKCITRSPHEIISALYCQQVCQNDISQTV